MNGLWRARHTLQLIDALASLTQLKEINFHCLSLRDYWVTGGHNGEVSTGRGRANTRFMFEFQWQKVNIFEKKFIEPAQTLTDYFDLSSKAAIWNEVSDTAIVVVHDKP